MEKPKPTQSLEQKQETPEDYVVATFPVDTDPDNARRPLNRYSQWSRRKRRQV
jgi:hypothetical protein